MESPQGRGTIGSLDPGILCVTVKGMTAETSRALILDSLKHTKLWEMCFPARFLGTRRSPWLRNIRTTV